MLFHTESFIVFFAVVWSAYWLLRTPRRQSVLLALASLVFYGAWDWRFVGLLLVSIVADFFIAQAIHRRDDALARKLFLCLSVSINLGILGFFKYFDFFHESFRRLLETFGLHADPITLRVILPVGISFYTFQTLGYTIDVYRRRVEPCREPWTFATYVAYFPQLVAGPIERAGSLIPQFQSPRTFAFRAQADGIYLFVRGLFKKVVVADNLSFFVDYVFGGQAGDSGFLPLLGVYAFAFQIYGDFSGYTDMARGISKTLGIELMQNFDSPYLAQGPRDFWRRWHISLSSWLRDYLYISLGGNRVTAARNYFNLFATMVLGGLWHGAGWTFVAWGIFHGLMLIVEHAFITRREKRGPQPAGRFGRGLRLVRAAAFFQLTCVGWLLFRARDWETLTSMVSDLTNAWVWNQEVANAAVFVLHFGLPLAILQWVHYFWPGRITRRPLSMTVFGLFMLAWILLEGVFGHGTQFIYFQF